MSSTETPPRLSQQCARGDELVVAVASERDTGGRSRSSDRQEQSDHERSWDDPVAEAMAYLISAHAILQDLESETFRDPKSAKLIASVCGNVFEALSTLDDFSVTQWIKSVSPGGIGCSFAPLPTWWRCLAD